MDLGCGHFWSMRMAEFTGHSHRHVFEDTLKKLYAQLYRQLLVSPVQERSSLHSVHA